MKQILITLIAFTTLSAFSCNKNGETVTPDNTVYLTPSAAPETVNTSGGPMIYWRAKVNTSKAIPVDYTVVVEWVGYHQGVGNNDIMEKAIPIPANNSGTIGANTTFQTNGTSTPTTVRIKSITCPDSKYVFSY